MCFLEIIDNKKEKIIEWMMMCTSYVSKDML
jgi:hypothetical protein